MLTFLLLLRHLPEHRGLPLHQQGAAPEEPFEKRRFLCGETLIFSLLFPIILCLPVRVGGHRPPPATFELLPLHLQEGPARPRVVARVAGDEPVGTRAFADLMPQKKKWRFFCC